MAMLRLARRNAERSAPSRRGDRPDLVRLLVSVRSPADLYFADELPGPEVTVAYTRAAPPGTARGVGRRFDPRLLRPDVKHVFRPPDVSATEASHVRLSILPDGGVARLRVRGAPV